MSSLTVTAGDVVAPVLRDGRGLKPIHRAGLGVGP